MASLALVSCVSDERADVQGHVTAGSPKLLVMIALDQFRAGYLEEYDEAFTDGFRRLRDGGQRYDRAIVDHAPTLSYPGHSTLATGAHPRAHGFNQNDWVETLPRVPTVM
jgi:predicted AlkP superfamily pyrophosphatase or phosphodiesterase